jgi:hypothetical protein
VDGRLFYVTGGFAAMGVEAIVATNIARDGSLASDPNALGLDCRRRVLSRVVSELVVQARISLCRLAG